MVLLSLNFIFRYKRQNLFLIDTTFLFYFLLLSKKTDFELIWLFKKHLAKSNVKTKITHFNFCFFHKVYLLNSKVFKLLNISQIFVKR